MQQYHAQSGKLEKARKRVKAIKGFYRHLLLYLVVNTVLLLLSGRITFVLLSDGALENVEFLKWINWNLWGTSIGWGIGLLFHGLYVFFSNPFKNWEQWQIQKVMREEREQAKKFGNN